jgi:threonine/homoserine/homoserine lactone efflux protein
MTLGIQSAAFLLRGILVGLVLAIPVGPIALLCMRRTLEKGWLLGFLTGVGAAVADGMYGAAAALGIAAVANFLHHYRLYVRLIGGLFMLFLAARLIFRRSIPTAPPPRTTGRVLGTALSGFVLTATNPMTMVGFAAVFTSVGLGGALHNTAYAAWLVLGVVLGSALWWFTLTVGVLHLRHLISEKTLHGINLVAGIALAVCGLYAINSVMNFPAFRTH